MATMEDEIPLLVSMASVGARKDAQWEMPHLLDRYINTAIRRELSQLLLNLPKHLYRRLHIFRLSDLDHH